MMPDARRCPYCSKVLSIADYEALGGELVEPPLGSWVEGLLERKLTPTECEHLERCLREIAGVTAPAGRAR